MHRLSSTIIILLTLAFTRTLAAAENQEGLACSQLGREIALRAAEQLGSAINTDNRATLAAIAQDVCTEFRVGAVDVATPEAPAAAPATVEEDSASRGFFNPEIIDPAERVRRPGLKRL